MQGVQLRQRLLCLAAVCCVITFVHADLPIVVNTWPFTQATEKAWDVLKEGGNPLDAVEQGCTMCEELQCDGTVGYGGSPDDQGQVTLDAVIMDGSTMEVGAVAALQHVKQAIAAARLVMERSTHTILAGLMATSFAVEMGLPPANLSTGHSNKIFAKWQAGNCQPNFRRRVHPNPLKHCGPYRPTYDADDIHVSGGGSGDDMVSTGEEPVLRGSFAGHGNHDTIAMVAVDKKGHVVAGASTNGASHKISGRVGDAAVAGAGVYADSTAGGCGATGDGDVHLRFMPCLQVVEAMRNGASPKRACEEAVRRMAHYYPRVVTALVAVDKSERHGGACLGWEFEYSVAGHGTGGKVEVVKVEPLSLMDGPRSDGDGGRGGEGDAGSKLHWRLGRWLGLWQR